MPPKASTRSAEKPAGPVTWKVIPSGRSVEMSARRASTVSASSDAGSMPMKVCAASPSSDAMMGEAETTPSRSPEASARAPSSPSCCSVSFYSLAKMAMAGT